MSVEVKTIIGMAIVVLVVIAFMKWESYRATTAYERKNKKSKNNG